MNAPHSRTVLVSARDGGGWSVVSMPQGISVHATRFLDAIRTAERIAAEREAQLSLRTEWLAGGDYGPRHLIGNPAVCRAKDGGGWCVVILNRPSLVGDLSREFVGPNAEAGSKRYAAQVVGVFAQMGREEQARRDRRKELASRKLGPCVAVKGGVV